MGLPTDLMTYFSATSSSQCQSLRNFSQIHPDLNESEMLSAVFRLCLDAHLLFVDRTWSGHPLDNTYRTQEFSVEDAVYGVYDFVVYGFVSVFNHFKKSVILLEYKDQFGSLQNGTAFIVIHNNKLVVVTAAHCVENATSLRLLTSAGFLPVPVAVYLPKASNHADGFESTTNQLDVAVIDYNSVDLHNYQPFRLAKPVVLDDVLVMGYPPTSLFTHKKSGKSILLCEKSTVSAIPSNLLGQVVGEGNSFLTFRDFFVVSARVKGGNSGGPVINKRGEVIGLISDFPTSGSSTDSLELDPNGFGLAVPGQDVSDFLNTCFFGVSEDVAFFNRRRPTSIDSALGTWKI